MGGSPAKIKEMRKALPLVILALSSWLQTYQLCDQYEDGVEAAVATPAVSAHQSHWTSPAAPDDDADRLIPSVADRALIHGAGMLAEPSRRSFSEFSFVLPAAVPPVQRVAQSRSPPGVFVPGSSPIVSLVLVRSLAHRLAPPLA